MSALTQKVQSTIGLTQNVPESFGGADFSIFKPRFFVEGENQFDCYHFVLSQVDVPSFVADGRKITLLRKTLLATNPDQKLNIPLKGILNNNSDEIKFICLFIETSKVRELAKSEFGRADLLFHNYASRYSNQVVSLLSRYEIETKNKQFGYRFILDCLSTEVTIQLIRELKTTLPEIQALKIYSSKKEINTAIDYLWENTTEDFSLDTLCKITKLNLYYFIRLFRDHTGKTPYEYYMDIKIYKAMQYLKSKQYSLTELCFLLGFSSHSHFSSVFRKKVGVTPSEYLKSF